MIDRRRVVAEEAPGRPAAGSRRARLRRLPSRLRGRAPAHWAFVLGLFVAVKVVLTLVGLVALRVYDDLPGTPPAGEATMRAEQHAVSSHRWISMWFAWDSFLYDKLSRAPLAGGWHSFSLPLLYPFLARAVAVLLGGNTAAALLLISNVALLFLLHYAHRLGHLLLGDEAHARRFTRYVVLMPAAFLFQAALTESLFLCLALAAFYHAERRHWPAVGVVGFFLALSRSVGFLVVVPLALILLRQHRAGPWALRGYARAGWPLLLVPGGWLTFMAFCKWQSGDWFAYKHAQEAGWGIVVQNPLAVLLKGVTSGRPADVIRICFAVAVLAVVVAGFRRAEAGYLLYTSIMVVVPLSIGPAVYKSLLRYLLAAFPVCLVLARWARTASVDAYLTAALALVQGILFVIWLAYWTHFII